MLNGILGYKLGMTQLFRVEGGQSVPVTVISAGPCKVVQIKTAEKEGYAAAQLAYDEVPARRLTLPLQGHYKKAHVPTARVLREFRGDLTDIAVGQVITSSLFQVGECVDVTGISKGKGFQGVIKRFHYRGGPATHGSMFHRHPGSIGASSFPSRVWKNKGLPGQMGGEQVTTRGLEIVDIRPEENLILVKGSVPGSANGLVAIFKSSKKPVRKATPLRTEEKKAAAKPARKK